MNIRLVFSVIFVILSLAVTVCGVVAFRSDKEIGKPLSALLFFILPPVIGNFLIIVSTARLPATIGCYMYYIGIDFTAFSLLRYVIAYTKLPKLHPKLRIFILLLLGVDVIQLLANIVFGHAFALEKIQLYGGEYYRMIPYLPQNLHRLLVYSILLYAVGIMFYRAVTSSRSHAWRYSVILYSMLFVIVWCSYYVVSRTPLDRSMIGYAAFGLLAFYFSLYYKPLRLMDRIMMDISAELPDALFFFDDLNTCIWVNKEGRRLTGFSGRNLDKISDKLTPFFEAGGPDPGDNWTADMVMDQENEKKYYRLERRTIRDDKGRIDGSFLNIHDDTQVQMDLQREAFIARHDDMTGLYNRQYLYQRIREILFTAKPEDEYSLIFLNVSNFKLINDTFGNSFGDEVLIQIGNLLRNHIPGSGIFGRLAGDTFGVLIPTGALSTEKAEEILSDFYVQNGELSYHVQILAGVYRITEPDLEVSVMFDRARMAVPSLKSDYHSHVAYYDDEMLREMLWEQQITSELENAIKTGQIVPFLQPLVDTEENVIGAEALVRWIHPELGFLPPAKFIPIFEKNGMIADIDRHMWRCACELLSKWKDNDMFLSINVSPKDFYFTNVASEIRSLVKEYDIDPARLRIEITESFMITDVENKIHILKGMQKDGFIVEMDDFGSGFSSLNMLKNMPIDVIKIDMVFLQNASDVEKSKKILRNIINMTTDLDIIPLTEGVETRRQYDVLNRMGCKMFQGYYFAKPMPVEEFEESYLKAV